jgi:membrane protein
MPNTHVRLKPALVSGFVAALLWIGWQKLYMSMQVGVSRYNALFGTFAAVPIFLAWLYVCWVIVLLGVEIAFALQNYSTFQMERAAPRASTQSKLLLALSIVTRAAEALERDRPPFEASAFAHERSVSIRLVNELVTLLSRAGLLAEVTGGQDRYVLVKDSERIRVKDVIDIIIEDGTPPRELGLENLGKTTRDVLKALGEGMDKALEGLTIQDLLPSTTS